jgi:hypothetical protein
MGSKHQLKAIFEWKTPGQVQSLHPKSQAQEASWRGHGVAGERLTRTPIVAPEIPAVSHFNEINGLAAI